jgi:AcrR family transcriptional regulator
MANGRVTLRPADFVRAAMAFVDEHGLEALTMRSLGDLLGVDPTALYRHFPSKDALLGAMLDTLVGEIVAQVPDRELPPRERVLVLLRRARTVFCRHPNLMGAFISSSGQWPNGLVLMRLGVEMLEDLGLRGRDLVVCQQMLEGFVIGSSVFDLAGSPHHHDIRRLRYRAVEREAYDDVSRTVDDVAAITDEAFERGLGGVLDLCERLASATTSTR